MLRRAFVIFLILLFPLNVFALSMSVASDRHAAAVEQVMPAALADAGIDVDQPSLGELDPDEPPSGMDYHDSVSGEGQPAPPLPPEGPVPPHVPLRHGLAPFPPIKPPPVR
ncbi:hypothetical protein [Massilia sp. Mn16-1_5]|uniref:hypothetical protein n=1 Tax=Massilia sp. Mn16-1_5 TaxID=2079199 RepID=UPI00109EBFB6|nr:hypothetical protein [Massilia sp. Mn16-1_5]THC44521.1 hypothetical protein C2862_08590 [Massilia sp. Mn16-1_5]